MEEKVTITLLFLTPISVKALCHILLSCRV
jgi:hypothetical protein